MRPLQELDSRHESLTPEQRELAELYTALMEAYEDRHYPVPHVTPIEFLQALLEQRGLAPSAIEPLLGGTGHTSEILNGRQYLPHSSIPFGTDSSQIHLLNHS